MYELDRNLRGSYSAVANVNAAARGMSFMSFMIIGREQYTYIPKEKQTIVRINERKCRERHGYS